MPSHRGAKILGKRNRGIDMIDIHCHILPDVDDGANDQTDALNMARMAALSGVTDIGGNSTEVPADERSAKKRGNANSSPPRC